MANLVMTSYKSNQLSDGVNLSSDTIQCALVTSGYTPAAADNFMTAIGANEIAVTNYTSGFSGTGRKTLGSITFATSGTQGEFHAANVTWSALGIGATVQALVLYKRGTSDTDSRIIAYFDFGTGIPTNGGDLTVAWASSGLIVLS